MRLPCGADFTAAICYAVRDAYANAFQTTGPGDHWAAARRDSECACRRCRPRVRVRDRSARCGRAASRWDGRARADRPGRLRRTGARSRMRSHGGLRAGGVNSADDCELTGHAFHRRVARARPVPRVDRPVARTAASPSVTPYRSRRHLTRLPGDRLNQPDEAGYVQHPTGTTT